MADGRDQLLLGAAYQQAVLVLRRGEAFESQRLRRPIRIGDLPGRQVRAADIADLALADQIVEGAQRLLDRGQRVGAVQLVEVDPVGLHPLQRGFDGLDDIAPRAALLHAGIVHVHAELAGEHDVLAAGAEQFAERQLRAAAIAVHVGGVEQGDAVLDRGVDDLARRFQVYPAAEIIAAEADERDAQAGAAEIAELHDDILPLYSERKGAERRGRDNGARCRAGPR